jgi:hypothetical protein
MLAPTLGAIIGHLQPKLQLLSIVSASLVGMSLHQVAAEHPILRRMAWLFVV